MEYAARTTAETSEAPPTNPRGLRLDRVPTPPPPPAIEQSPLEAAVDELDLEVIDLDAPEEPADDTSCMITAGEGAAEEGTAEEGSAREGAAEEDGRDGPRRRRSLRLVVVVAVCCLLGTILGTGLALLDRTAVAQQRRAVPILDTAAVAVQQVEVSAGPLDAGRTITLLERIRGLDTAARGSTGGLAWELARRTVRREPLTGTADRAAGLALIADAAAPLQASLRAVQAPAGAPGAGTADALDRLARDLNRFASVSIRAEELGTWTLPARPVLTASGGTAFERLATAAAILPTMAGSEAPRTWVICRSATAGCTRIVLDAGQIRSVRRVTPAARTGRNADITITGTAPGRLLTGRTWSVPAVLNLLVATGDGGSTGEDDATPVVTSTVPVEQHALEVLAGRRQRTGSRRQVSPTSTHA